MNILHNMHFFYLQLAHAIIVQGPLGNEHLSPTPIFNYMQSLPLRDLDLHAN